MRRRVVSLMRRVIEGHVYGARNGQKKTRVNETARPVFEKNTKKPVDIGAY